MPVLVLLALVGVAYSESDAIQVVSAEMESIELDRVEMPQKGIMGTSGVHAVGLAGRDALPLETLLMHCTNKTEAVMLTAFAANFGDDAKKVWAWFMFP
ncbi:hypothetical protein HDU81_000749 [Chytriomyces hyalinus]|nr:hypothetical protein HDU81_000749 [Chytriomyces hyalinus]